MSIIAQNTQATQVTFDDLLTYDFTEVADNRDSETTIISEFDLVRMPFNGMWIEGTVTFIDEDYIELDDLYMVDIEDAYLGELISKALTPDYNMEKLYAVALQAQTNYRNAIAS